MAVKSTSKESKSLLKSIGKKLGKEVLGAIAEEAGIPEEAMEIGETVGEGLKDSGLLNKVKEETAAIDSKESIQEVYKRQQLEKHNSLKKDISEREEKVRDLKAKIEALETENKELKSESMRREDEMKRIMKEEQEFEKMKV